MKVGDHVRMIKDTIEGFIVKELKGGMVEIEDEHGFTYPVLINDLAMVSSDEHDYFDLPSTNTVKPTIKPSSQTPDSIYVSYQTEKNTVKTELVNTTSDRILFMTYRQEQNQLTLINHGELERKATCFIAQYPVNDLPILHFFLIPVVDQTTTIPTPFQQVVKIKTKSLMNQTMAHPVDGSATYLVELKKEINLHESSLSTNQPEQQSVESMEVDLHIENLHQQPETLSSGEALLLQLKTCEEKLDEALMRNANTITFIHGLGSGKLKHHVAKILSQHPHVKYYEDANKEKFGYGATKATL